MSHLIENLNALRKDMIDARVQFDIVRQNETSSQEDVNKALKKYSNSYEDYKEADNKLFEMQVKIAREELEKSQ